MKMTKLYEDKDVFGVIAFVALAGAPVAVVAAFAGLWALAAGAGVVGMGGIWFVVGWVRYVRRLRAELRARAPSAAVAAIADRVGPPPPAIRVAVWGCYLVAAAGVILAAKTLITLDWRSTGADVFAVVVPGLVLLIAFGFFLSGRRLLRYGDPNTLYPFTITLGLASAGVTVTDFGHTPRPWGEMAAYAVATVVFVVVACLPGVGPGARWLKRYRAAVAEHYRAQSASGDGS